MTLFLWSLAMLPAGAAAVLVMGRFRKTAAWIFIGALGSFAVLAILSSFAFLRGHAEAVLRLPCGAPFGELAVGLDPLSAFFIMTIAAVSFACGVYGTGYLSGRGQNKNTAPHYFFYLLTTASMIIVVTARNALAFLTGWELMTVLAYFLVTFNDEKKSVRDAGYLYLVATHCGTFCILAMFALMGGAAGSMDFEAMRAFHYEPVLGGFLFALGLLGFGVKAGLFPVHIWLPHAHPAAPSHISGLLSGVVIKTGIYGILRLIVILGNPPSWAGPVTLLAGVVSGVLGVAYALGQHEIKRLLAYHSIENIGIIAIGMGIGLIGTAAHQESIALIGYAGALLHVLNHALFKSLLFLSAGSVISSTGTGEIDEMGGLLKALPYTGHLFLIGSLSICGLPLFNGFVSEWLIYRALFSGAVHFDKPAIIAAVLALVSLALIGGLAAACFAKAFSVMFLGKSRAHGEKSFKESAAVMRAPMVFLAAVCVWIGLFPAVMAAGSFAGARTLVTAAPQSDPASLLAPLLPACAVLYLFLLMLGLAALLRKFLIRREPARFAETWGCGYAAPSPRMQYTASSFAAPLLVLFRAPIGLKVRAERPRGFFPKDAGLSSEAVDLPEHLIFRPAITALRKLSRALSGLQSGRIPQYLFYLFLALVILLLWKFPRGA